MTKSMKDFIALMVILFALLLVRGCQTPAYAAINRKMVKAVMAESAGESLEGQIAVACAIYNRPDGLTGVVTTLNRVPRHYESHKAERAMIFATPEKCWELIRGADMWCSNIEQCRKSWNEYEVKLHYITTIGNHHFFRRITTKGE